MNGAIVLTALAFAGILQEPAAQGPAAEPARAEVLRGEYGRYRANNDLLAYHLDIRVDPAEKSIEGRNAITFKMLADDNQIQLELFADLSVDEILWRGAAVEYTRELNTVFVRFPEQLEAGDEHTIDFYYSGKPQETGRFGGITFREDPAGRPWINTACEGPGSSCWWPGKDQWRDEVQTMDISVSVPSDLVNVSNGRLMGKEDLGDGYTRWNYRVHYPINSYNVSINVGAYEHFSETLGDLSLDYYVLPEDLERARKQFAQVKPMMEAFEHCFGPYPFPKDGYKLIQVPYTGMEHQSAVTYGNRFQNGYYGRDWTGVGVSLKFDFIIIHESGHEWWGNSVSASDVSDMWIHEGWTTYAECLYVEHVFGSEDALKYTNGYKSKVRNQQPIITERGRHQVPSQDMYFKGALFLHTLRNVLDDDERWRALVRDIYQKFKYRNILTEDLVPVFNAAFGTDMTPVFDQYLRHAALPVLELRFDAEQGTVAYRWKADEPKFAMPIRVGRPDAWQTIRPGAEWQTMPTSLDKDTFEVATDLYYVEVAVGGERAH